MNERFTRLFSLPENSYTGSSPLLIAAGALLRDNQTGGVLAQLKLKNLDQTVVRAVKVRLWLTTALGVAVPEPVEYTYMDLNAGRGAEFGVKNPISLPDPTVRSFRAEILEAAFADGSHWAAPEGAAWAPLPAGQTVEAALGDGELVKELRLRQGADCRFVPARYGELWRCACGEIVRGERCPACGKGFFELDLPALTQARDARVAAERAAEERLAAEAAEKARLEAERAAAEAAEKAAKAEKARGRRKKVGKALGITILLAILIAAGVLLGIPGLSAIQAGKAARAGDYVTAVEKYWAAEDWGIFAALFHPGEKAKALTPAAHYQEGEEARAEGRYQDAITAFEAAGDYEDAAQQVVSCAPGAVKEAAEAGDLERAETYLAMIETTGENAALRGEAKLYLAKAYAEAGDYDTAVKHLSSARYDKNDAALVQMAKETRYLVGTGYLEKGDYDRALTQFNILADYQDSSRLLQLARIGVIRNCLEKGEWNALLFTVEKVDVSRLTAEEKAEYQSLVYDCAKAAEGKKEYRTAFALYENSGKGDYKTRMDACNRNYIAQPRKLTGMPQSDRSEKIKINEVTVRYHDGKVTFTVSYTASISGRWGFYAFQNDSAYPNPSGAFDRYGSPLTFDVPYSTLTGNYSVYYIELYNYNDGMYYYYSVSFYPSTIRSLHLDQDLYGNPIP